MDTQSRYGKKLLDHAVTLGLTQSEIANYLEIHRIHVHRWKHGRRPVPDHYHSRLFGLIVTQGFPRYTTKLKALMQGTSEERLKAEEERLHLREELAELEELITQLKSEPVLDDSILAFKVLKAMPMEGLYDWKNAPAIAECATALLKWANTFIAGIPCVGYIKEVKRALIRESSELGGDGQSGTVYQ